MQRRLALLLAALAPLGGGCAAALIPVVAGGTILGKQTGMIGGDKEKAPAPDAAADLPPAPTPAPPVEVAVLTQTSPSQTLAPQAESIAQEPGDYSAFLAFATAQARKQAQGKLKDSVLLAPGYALGTPRFLPCGKLPPAVLIDLDGDAADDGGDAEPAEGLATGLQTLRRAGVSVVWISDAPLDRIGMQRNRLRESGLDSEGQDAIFTRSRAQDRKQATRFSAASEFCIIALAGDRRGEADELYAYLKAPEAAAVLEPLWGAGWFLLPPPLEAPAPEDFARKEDDDTRD